MEEYTRTGRDRRKQPNPRPFPRRRIVENQAQRVCVSSPLLSLLLLFAAFSSLSLSDFPFLFGRRAWARLSRATLLFYDLVSAAAFLFFSPPLLCSSFSEHQPLVSVLPCFNLVPPAFFNPSLFLSLCILVWFVTALTLLRFISLALTLVLSLVLCLSHDRSLLPLRVDFFSLSPIFSLSPGSSVSFAPCSGCAPLAAYPRRNRSTETVPERTNESSKRAGEERGLSRLSGGTENDRGWASTERFKGTVARNERNIASHFYWHRSHHRKKQRNFCSGFYASLIYYSLVGSFEEVEFSFYVRRTCSSLLARPSFVPSFEVSSFRDLCCRIRQNCVRTRHSGYSNRKFSVCLLFVIIGLWILTKVHDSMLRLRFTLRMCICYTCFDKLEIWIYKSEQNDP